MLTPDKNTYCVIMAGGIGSRFWPMSTADFPKQFHDILGIGKTLIRMTFERILPICTAENILVVTNERYKHLVKEHIPEIPTEQILCEPLMRNTAPCLAYAHFWIQNKNPDANVVVLSADQLITNEAAFITDIKKGIKHVSEYPRLLTIGIKPSSPNTGYGYIQFDDSVKDESIREVITFTEKPDLPLAEKFLQSGDFFWNSGIFLWSLKTIQNQFESDLPEIYELFHEVYAQFSSPEEQKVIADIYPKCQSISIDYGILEKAKNVDVILSDFGWSDLGTWGSVYHHLEKNSEDNAVSGARVAFFESRGNLVKLNTLKKAVIQGLEDYVIVESNGVLLITRKDQEQRVKQFSKSIS